MAIGHGSGRVANLNRVLGQCRQLGVEQEVKHQPRLLESQIDGLGLDFFPNQGFGPVAAYHIARLVLLDFLDFLVFFAFANLNLEQALVNVLCDVQHLVALVDEDIVKSRQTRSERLLE